jgi:hypothetical protein
MGGSAIGGSRKSKRRMRGPPHEFILSENEIRGSRCLGGQWTEPRLTAMEKGSWLTLL